MKSSSPSFIPCLRDYTLDLTGKDSNFIFTNPRLKANKVLAHLRWSKAHIETTVLGDTRNDIVKGEMNWSPFCQGVLNGEGRPIKEMDLITHVLTGWNHELFNWAKLHIFQGLCKNICNLLQ